MTGNGKKQRRTNRTHAGVVLQKKRHRSGRVTWRARYTDPETGRVVYVSMDRLEMTNQEKREAWAADRSATTLGEIARMKAGKKKRQRIGIRKAVDEFFARKRHELRPRTVKCYEDTAETFLAWTDRAGLKLTIDLTPPVLTRFRAETISRPRCRPQRGGRQGKYAASDRKLAPATINRDLLQVRVILNELRRVGYLPDLDTDAIKDSLRNVMGQRPVPTFLRTPELRMPHPGMTGRRSG